MLSVGIVALGERSSADAIVELVDAIGRRGPVLGCEPRLITTTGGAEMFATTGIPCVRVLRRSAARGSVARVAHEQAIGLLTGCDALHFTELTGPLFAPWIPFTTTATSAPSAPNRRERMALASARRVVTVGAETASALRAAGQAFTERIVDLPRVPWRSAGRSPEPPIFLTVGARRARHVIAGHARAGSSIPLVVAVPPGEPFLRVIGQSDGVEYVPIDDPATLDRLLERSVAVLHANERDGDTPLLAAAWGAPLAIAGERTLARAVGAAALVVDCDSAELWETAIRALTVDVALRAHLRLEGYALARRRLYDNAADQVLGALRRPTEHAQAA